MKDSALLFLLKTKFLIIFHLLSLTSIYGLTTQQPGILIIGGTRFTGLSLWKELYDRGYNDITLYNRGKTPNKQIKNCGLHKEDIESYNKRIQNTKFIIGNRQNTNDINTLINPNLYDYVYDMNARSIDDTKPLAEVFVGRFQ